MADILVSEAGEVRDLKGDLPIESFPKVCVRNFELLCFSALAGAQVVRNHAADAVARARAGDH